MKAELIEKLKNLLAVEDVSTNKREIKELKETFKIEVANNKQLQLDAWNNIEHAEGEDFEYAVSEEENIFDSLFKTYEERIKEIYKKVGEEQLENLKQKKALLSQLEAFVQNENNIGKSFLNFNSISEKWRAIGNIPKDEYPKMNAEYQRLRELFFYNITIYKELQEYDLKVNLKKKEELIQKAKALEEIKSIKECEYILIQLQQEWNEIGPSPKETYKELGDAFFSAIRTINTKIRNHYTALTTEIKNNLALKSALIVETKTITEKEITNHNEWIKKTDIIIALQEKWKSFGYFKNKENEEMWLEFRKICDVFFERKKQFYAIRNEEFTINKNKKLALIEKAKQIAGNADWDKTTEEFLKLQKEWKDSGSTFQKEEQPLWHLFRESCDVFFARKKEHYNKQEELEKENLTAKQKLLGTIEAYELSEDMNENIHYLKEFSKQWNAIGFVPKKYIQKISSTYNEILTTKFGTLTDLAEKNPVVTFEQKIELLKSAPNSEYLVKKESEQLRKKMEALRQQKSQYENNMGFFSNSSGSEILKTEVKKKVNAVEIEIEKIKKQLQLL